MATLTEKAQEKAEQVKEAVKESLVGVEEEPQASAETQAGFAQRAIRDEETGEYYMGQKEFVDAVAPPDQDYVSTLPALFTLPLVREGKGYWVIS